MKKATVYTRRGDNGTTSLATGERVKKDDAAVEAYGTIDELNAHLGLLAAAISDEPLRCKIVQIENKLFAIGGYIAYACTMNNPVSDEDIKKLELEIDLLDASLEPIKNFLLPPDVEAAARANVCRTICRRAERRVVAYAESTPLHNNVLMYINRLSDYLFILSRILSCGNEKFVEKYWK